MQTGDFADFEQFKIDSHFDNFGQEKIGPTCLSSYFNEFEQHMLQKTIQTFPILEKIRIWHKSLSMIQSAGIKNWLGSPVSKYTSKV